MVRSVTVACLFALLLLPREVDAQSFENAVVDVGNIGLTVTNAGFLGRANVRNAPTGPPSMEYPLDSGVEHLFEAGLWVGAVRSDGIVTVRTAAVTTGGGYSPGTAGYEMAQASTILRRSSLPTSDAFTRRAVSHLDYLTAFEDTSTVLPGTSIQMPDPAGQLGMFVNMTSYAWNFPFTESLVILQFDIANISSQPWDSVYVGLYHDLVVRNINTTQDGGGAFFNKGGFGYIDSLQASYAFNAGGLEQSLNTYGAVVALGAEWRDPTTGLPRFFHPGLADEYEAEGLSAPAVNPRWWLFGGGTDDESRPATDEEKYRRMATPFPNPASFDSEAEFADAQDAWYQRLASDGTRSLGNWIGMTPLGPIPRVEAGDTVSVAFALVAALKPEEFQGQIGKAIDVPESRVPLAASISWARRTFGGEDTNYNGRLDPDEDANGNGVLDRFLIPEPPAAPGLRVEFERDSDGESVVALYWDRTAEESRDPVSGLQDFEGYRIYRSNPGDDLSGDIVNRSTLIAQYDLPDTPAGFNSGFDDILLDAPRTFSGDETEYWYRFEARNLKRGWQYLFSVTAIDQGDKDAGLESFESSRVANAVRVFPGTPAAEDESLQVGVYPNPYRVNAAWDGGTSRTRKLHFYNLPPRADIRIYTLAGEIVREFRHEAESYIGDSRWFDDFSAPNRQLSGGEHAWDLLSENGLSLTGGLYLYTVQNLDSEHVQRGKFVIIK